MYQKSKLWEYLCENRGLRWEKRKIKEELKIKNLSVFNSLKHNTDSHRIDDCGNPEQDYKYVRALLGLAEQYEFMKKDNTKLKVKIDDISSSNKIDRFKSPLSYSILGNEIFLIVRNVDPLLHTYKNKNGEPIKREFNFNVGSYLNFTLEVPNDFDILDFITKKSGYKKEF